MTRERKVSPPGSERLVVKGWPPANKWVRIGVLATLLIVSSLIILGGAIAMAYGRLALQPKQFVQLVQDSCMGCDEYKFIVTGDGVVWYMANTRDRDNGHALASCGTFRINPAWKYSLIVRDGTVITTPSHTVEYGICVARVERLD